MLQPQRWPKESWILLIAGLAWLRLAATFDPVGFLASVVPGCLLLASGVSSLLYPGDLRIPQFAALGGGLGIPLAVPALFVAGPGTGVLLIGLSAASWIAAGSLSVRHEPPTEEVPDPVPSFRLSAEVAGDDALLGIFTVSLPMVLPAEQARVAREVHAARELFGARGWLEKPADYHQAPPPLEKPEILRRSSRGLDLEHLRFPSDYEPRFEEPGRERWLSYAPNRSAHAWVLRHEAPARPWLVCIHGYQMGFPAIDLQIFRAARLHHELGLNLLLPVLPLHGPRKIGRRSGDGFLTGDVLDTVHAEAQAMWDLRRLLSWIRAEGGERIGVYGLSLGGYNTALLACLDEALACAVAGIPLADPTRAIWRHGPPLQIRYAERQGVVHDEVSEVMGPASPLVLKPRVAHERRYIFGAVADRLVTPDHVRDLWRHWERPEILWYQGSHVSFRFHPEVAAFLDGAFRDSRLIL